MHADADTWKIIPAIKENLRLKFQLGLWPLQRIDFVCGFEKELPTCTMFADYSNLVEVAIYKDWYSWATLSLYFENVRYSTATEHCWWIAYASLYSNTLSLFVIISVAITNESLYKIVLLCTNKFLEMTNLSVVARRRDEPFLGAKFVWIYMHKWKRNGMERNKFLRN